MNTLTRIDADINSLVNLAKTLFKKASFCGDCEWYAELVRKGVATIWCRVGKGFLLLATRGRDTGNEMVLLAIEGEGGISWCISELFELMKKVGCVSLYVETPLVALQKWLPRHGFSETNPDLDLTMATNRAFRYYPIRGIPEHRLSKSVEAIRSCNGR